MKTPRRIDFYLQDMVTAMERIASYINGHDLESFINNFMVTDAVVRNFEIIGEASKHIPDEIQIKYNHIPWKKMYQLRNIVSHDYFEVDYETIWQIAQTQLPNNLIDIKEVIKLEKLDS